PDHGICSWLHRPPISTLFPYTTLFRSYNLTRPYAAAPDLRPGGWFDTGDVGRLDGAGRLAVTGRVDDMVIVSGFNVHPAEVETRSEEHTSELQSREKLVCRLLLETKKT